MQAITLSDHAYRRAAQRNLSLEDIEFVAQYAYRERRTGGIFCQFRRNSIPTNNQEVIDCDRLIGTTLLLCKCGCTVITLYRNPRAFKKDRRKAKYDHSKTCSNECKGCDGTSAA